MGARRATPASTRITGTTPATAASKRSCTPCSRAAAHSSSPCWREQLLVGGDDVAARRASRAGRSRAPGRARPSARRSGRQPARISSKSPRVRVSTPRDLGPQPGDRARSASARSREQRARTPSRPCRGRAGRRGRAQTYSRAQRQVLVGLAAHDDARVAAGGRRPRAGAGRRCSCWPSRARRRRSTGVTSTSPGRGSAQVARRATSTSPDSQCLPTTRHGASRRRSGRRPRAS